MLSSWLDRGWEARFLVDEQLRLLWSNGAANAWLEEVDCPLRLQRDTLVAKDNRFQVKLTAMVASCSRATSGMLMGGCNGAQDLLFSSREVGRFGGFRCMGLAVRSIKAKDTDELVGLGDAYNLTPSEETVLQKMMRGNNVEKIARSSNTSPETVRTHVRRAYSKMSVSSREEMFSRLKPFLFDR
jgi:DNA-binding CsgD family transcriptional regulator